MKFIFSNAISFRTIWKTHHGIWLLTTVGDPVGNRWATHNLEVKLQWQHSRLRWHTLSAYRPVASLRPTMPAVPLPSSLALTAESSILHDLPQGRLGGIHSRHGEEIHRDPSTNLLLCRWKASTPLSHHIVTSPLPDPRPLRATLQASDHRILGCLRVRGDDFLGGSQQSASSTTSRSLLNNCCLSFSRQPTPSSIPVTAQGSSPTVTQYPEPTTLHAPTATLPTTRWPSSSATLHVQRTWPRGYVDSTSSGRLILGGPPAVRQSASMHSWSTSIPFLLNLHSRRGSFPLYGPGVTT